jgi:sugar phosphate isomerase/epimerase
MRSLSVSTAAYDGYAPEVAFAELAALGVRAVEPAYIKGYVDFAEADFSEAKALELLEKLSAEGLKAQALSAHLDLSAPGSAEALSRRVEFAQAIGAGILITNAGPKVGEAAICTAIEANLPALEGAGVVLALENPGHGSGDLIGNGAEGAAFVASLGAPRVRLNYDIANAYTYGGGRVRPETDISHTFQKLAHVHLKDVAARGTDWAFVALGEGEAGAEGVALALAAGPREVPLGLELPLRLARPGRAAPLRARDPVPLPAIRAAIARSLEFWRKATATG